MNSKQPWIEERTERDCNTFSPSCSSAAQNSSSPSYLFIWRRKQYWIPIQSPLPDFCSTRMKKSEAVFCSRTWLEWKELNCFSSPTFLLLHSLTPTAVDIKGGGNITELHITCSLSLQEMLSNSHDTIGQVLFALEGALYFRRSLK